MEFINSPSYCFEIIGQFSQAWFANVPLRCGLFFKVAAQEPDIDALIDDLQERG
jgi:hypothetical protein